MKKIFLSVNRTEVHIQVIIHIALLITDIPQQW